MSWITWNNFKKYILNIDTIVVIFIFILVIYFICTRKRKTYEFKGVDGHKLKFEIPKKKRVKKVRGKPKFNKHEEECRRIFQDIFGDKFKSVRPSWLKNPVTGKNLELDGFNPYIDTPKGIGLAFEYDGEQHARYNSHFHKAGVEEFKYQVKKDDFKDLKCKERGVVLIRIPHFVAYQDLDRYIRSELDRQKISIISRSDRNIYR